MRRKPSSNLPIGHIAKDGPEPSRVTRKAESPPRQACPPADNAVREAVALRVGKVNVRKKRGGHLELLSNSLAAHLP
jgi:hypothetical protein